MIFLVGYRAVGKTTIGRALAKKFAWDFVDLDEWICDNASMSVADIVATEGWQGFRRREQVLLRKSFTLQDTVVATGGGAVLHQEEWQAEKKHGLTVWLQADTAVICERLRQAPPGLRPSLTCAGLLKEVESVLLQRQPLYEAVAELRVRTDKNSVDEAVLLIADYYQELNTVKR